MMRGPIRQELNPHMEVEDELKIIGRKWTIGEEDPFPLPKFTVRCPICGNKHVQLRLIQFIYKTEGYPYHANVSFRCTRCGAVWNHTIPVPEKMFKLHAQDNPNQSIIFTPDEVEKILKGDKQ